MPRRRKRMTPKGTIPGATKRYDEGYNPGDTGYYPGIAEGKPKPRTKPKGTIPGKKPSTPPGKTGTPGAKEFIDRPGTRNAVGRRPGAIDAPPKKRGTPKSSIDGSLSAPGRNAAGPAKVTGPKSGLLPRPAAKSSLTSGGAYRIGGAGVRHTPRPMDVEPLNPKRRRKLA
jgi:hypothetical protein